MLIKGFFKMTNQSSSQTRQRETRRPRRSRLFFRSSIKLRVYGRELHANADVVYLVIVRHKVASSARFSAYAFFSSVFY